MVFTLLDEIDCKQGAIRAVRFSVDGAYCLSCGSDGKLKLWNPYRGVCLKIYGGHADQVADASAACDSSRIVSCGMDKSVIVWDVASGAPIRRLRGHAGAVTSARFNEESSMVVSGSRDNTAMCWDVRSKSREAVQTLNEAKDAVSSVALSDHEILTASFDGAVRRYDIRAGQLSADFAPDAITCASFTRDGQCVLASCADGSVKLTDKDSGECLGEFEGHVADDLCLESSVDNRDTRVLSGSADGNLWIWELASRRVVEKLACRRDSPTCTLSVHPLKNSIITANAGKMFIWEEAPPNTTSDE